MMVHGRELAAICAVLCMAATADLSAQLRSTRTLAPSISGVTPSTISVEPGSSVRFTVSGSNLSKAQELKFYAGTRELFGDVLTGRIVSTSSGSVSLAAIASRSASPGATYQMKLVVGTSTLSIPAAVEIAPAKPTYRSENVQVDDLFATPIQGVLNGASTYFASCGGSSAERRWELAIPNGGYSANGSLPRFERQTSTADRVKFLEDHTLDPSDVYTGEFTDLFESGHPSPVNHTVSQVRMCLVPHRAAGNWHVVAVEPTAAGGNLIVRVAFDRMLFRARGMPMTTTGTDGSMLGIQWGTVITDAELPDLEWTAPSYELRIPIEVAGGQITYGTPAFRDQRSSRITWSSQFLGPSTLRDEMRRWSDQRMATVADQIQTALNDGRVRSAVSQAVMSRLQSMHGIDDVVSVEFNQGEMWTVTYR